MKRITIWAAGAALTVTPVLGAWAAFAATDDASGHGATQVRVDDGRHHHRHGADDGLRDHRHGSDDAPGHVRHSGEAEPGDYRGGRNGGHHGDDHGGHQGNDD
jgi:hypothetical protein